MKKAGHSFIFIIVPIFILLFLFDGCSSPAPVTRSGFMLNTTVSVTLYKPADKALLDGCFELIQAEENTLSRTVEGSDIWKINHAKGQPVEVSEVTEELLETSKKYGDLSDGAFDVTIAPVSGLWDFTSASPHLPDENALKSAAQLVDYRQIKLTPSSDTNPAVVQLTNPQAEIDLGGIAKGYIADRLKDYLTDKGVTSALIDLGGNLYAVGKKDNRAWNIGIRDPDNPQRTAAKLSITNQSAVTSGSYERSFEINHILYHHILYPKTGQPVRNGLKSVTIICPRSADADALSTACFVLGKERGLALIESLPETEALFIEGDGTFTASSGLQYTRTK